MKNVATGGQKAVHRLNKSFICSVIVKLAVLIGIICHATMMELFQILELMSFWLIEMALFFPLRCSCLQSQAG